MDFIRGLYDYSAYGRVTRQFVAGGIRHRFKSTAHERDLETGYDYRGARWSDPGLGRFLSVDPLAWDAPSWSPFNAMWNNPIKYIDPDGKWAGEPGCCGSGNALLYFAQGVGQQIEKAYNDTEYKVNQFYQKTSTAMESTMGKFKDIMSSGDRLTDNGTGSTFYAKGINGNDNQVRKGKSEGAIDVGPFVLAPMRSDPLSKGHEFFMHGVGVQQAVEGYYPLAEKVSESVFPKNDTVGDPNGVQWLRENGDTVGHKRPDSELFYFHEKP